MFKRTSNRMFVGSLIISGILFIQMSVYMISKFAGWNVRFNLIEVCQSWLKAIGLTSLEYILDALVIYTFVFFIWKIGHQVFHFLRMKKRIERYKEHTLTSKMNNVFNSEKNEIIVISHPGTIAITMGFFRPNIVLSTGLINILTEDEIEAVIYHEMYHAENRDPLKLFLMSLSAGSLWYIPILTWCKQKYTMVNELLADTFSVGQQATPLNLSSALLKMVKVGRQEKIPVIHASFAETSVNFRISYLLHPLTVVPIQLPLKAICISFTIFSLLCLLFIYALV